MSGPYRKSAAKETDSAALEKLSRLADQVGVSIEDLTLLLEKKPELVRNQILRTRAEIVSALEFLKLTL